MVSENSELNCVYVSFHNYLREIDSRYCIIKVIVIVNIFQDFRQQSDYTGTARSFWHTDKSAGNVSVQFG